MHQERIKADEAFRKIVMEMMTGVEAVSVAFNIMESVLEMAWDGIRTK